MKKKKSMNKRVITLFVIVFAIIALAIGGKLFAGTVLKGTLLGGNSDNQKTAYHQEWVNVGTVISTGVGKSYQEATTGMHEYEYQRKESVNPVVTISKWTAQTVATGDTVSQKKCSNFGITELWGYEFAASSCGQNTIPGWYATCADCGKVYNNTLIFLNSEGAQEVKKIDLRGQLISSCYNCNSLYTGANLNGFNHRCKNTSYNKYDIEYNANGGVGSMSNTTHMYNNATVYEQYSANETGFSTKLAANTYAKDGYVFVGWNTKADGTGTSYANEAEVLNLTAENNATVTLYAQYVNENQTLIVNPNGGIWNGLDATQNLTVKYKAEKTIELPTRTGYVFTGWTLTGKGSTMSSLTANNATFTMGEETATLKANWEAAKYSIKYNGNGATSGTMINSVHTYNVEKALTTNIYERKYTLNYEVDGVQDATVTATFNGWAKSESGDVKYTDGQTVKNLTTIDGEIIEIFANWTLKKVKFDAATKQGNIFLGWSTNQNATEAEFKADEEITLSKNMTVYPVFKPIEIEVSVKDSRTDTFIQDAKIEITDFNSNKVTEWTTSDKAHNIKEIAAGKYILKVVSINNYFNILEKEITVEATTKKQEFKVEPEIKRCTLTVNPNGGKWNNSSNEKEFTLEYNQTKEIELPTRKGYIFAGWELKGNLSTMSSLTLNNATFTMGIENATLTASWELAKYNVKYNGNGATSGTMENSVHEYTIEKALNKNLFKREYKVNYEYERLEDKIVSATYNGWAIEKDGKVKYKDEEKVLNLTAVEGETFEIFANWTLGKVVLETPTREGYIALGWSTNKDAQEAELKCGEEITPTKDITLYPVWKPLEIEISIIDSETKEFIKDAKIQLVDLKGNKTEEWTTEDKAHNIKGIAEGGYILTIVDIPELYNTLEQNITVETTDKKQEVKIELHKKSFDMSLNVWLSKISTIIDGNTTVKETGNKPEKEEMPKIDIKSSQIDSTKIKFEYTIRVTNEGEVTGIAQEIIDYIPKGLKFIQADNSGWTLEGNIAKTDLLNKVEIKPGESKNLKIILTWVNEGNNFDIHTNIVELGKVANQFGINDIDSATGNKVGKEDDLDDSKVIVSIRTGVSQIPTTALLVTLFILLAVVIIVDRTEKRKTRKSK